MASKPCIYLIRAPYYAHLNKGVKFVPIIRHPLFAFPSCPLIFLYYAKLSPVHPEVLFTLNMVILTSLNGATAIGHHQAAAIRHQDDVMLGVASLLYQDPGESNPSSMIHFTVVHIFAHSWFHVVAEQHNFYGLSYFGKLCKQINQRSCISQHLGVVGTSIGMIQVISKHWNSRYNSDFTHISWNRRCHVKSAIGDHHLIIWKQ